MEIPPTHSYHLIMMPEPVFPLRVFFDGQCPLCRREIKHYLTLDHQEHLLPVDIAAPDFQAQYYGLDPQHVQRVMHAMDASGRVYTQVDAFVAIWQGVKPTLFTRTARRLLTIYPVGKLAGWAYLAIARNRYRVTGRCIPQRCGPKSFKPVDQTRL